MQKRSLMFLAMAAVLAVASAVWMTSSQQPATDLQNETALFPDLLKQINQVDRVEIRAADDSVTLIKGETGWTVQEKNGYPANMRNLRKQLIAIAEATILEAKTSNPDNYSQLGVADVAAGSDSVSVNLGGLDTTVNLLLGKQNYRGQASTYIRRADQAQSYLVSGSLKMASKPGSWLLKDIFNLGAPRVSRTMLKHADGSVLEIVKHNEADPNFSVLSIPEGRELASPGAGNSVAGALGSLRLEDVAPADTVEAGDSPVVEGLFETFDGLRVLTRVWQQEDQHYLVLSVEFDSSLIPVPDIVPEAEAEPPENSVELIEQPAEDLVDHEQEAREMQATVAGWAFVIPSYKYDNLSKTVYDLLKPLPVEQPDSEG